MQHDLPLAVAEDPNALGNGDLAIRTSKGTLVALVYAQPDGRTRELAERIADTLTVRGQGLSVREAGQDRR